MNNELKYITDNFINKSSSSLGYNYLDSKINCIINYLKDSSFTFSDMLKKITSDDEIKISINVFRNYLKKNLLSYYTYHKYKLIFLNDINRIKTTALLYDEFEEQYGNLISKGCLIGRGRSKIGVLKYELYCEFFIKYESVILENKKNRVHNKVKSINKSTLDSNEVDLDLEKKESVSGVWADQSDINRAIKLNSYCFDGQVWNVSEERFFYFPLAVKKGQLEYQTLLELNVFKEGDLLVLNKGGISEFYRYLDNSPIKINKQLSPGLESRKSIDRGFINTKALKKKYL